MKNLLLAILIYSITIIYFLLSNKTIYVYTLKYYSLIDNIYDDKDSLKILVNHLIIYKIIVRYLRIHLISSSIIITINFIFKMPFIAAVIKFLMIFASIIALCDFLSFKARLKALEDRLYITYYNLDS